MTNSSFLNYRIPLDSDLNTFFSDRDVQNTIKEYEYLLKDKQESLDNYVKYLATAFAMQKLIKYILLRL